MSFLLLSLVLSFISPVTNCDDLLKQLEEIKSPTVMSLRNTGREKRIEINNQNDFNHIQDLILAAQEEGNKNIVVTLSSDTFYYHEQHILLRKQIQKETSLKIKGNRTVVISQGRFLNKPVFDYSKVYLTTSMKNFDVWSPFYEAENDVEIVNLKTKECRVFCETLNEVNLSQPDRSFIQISQWYRCPVYSITKIDKGWVFFIADDLNVIDGSTCYNVNSDNFVSKKRPIFRLCNVNEYDGIKEGPVYECTESLFLYLDQSHYRQIEVSGISFYGNCSREPFVRLMKSSGQLIDVRDCQFHSMQSMCIYAFDTDNMVIRNNEFFDMYNNAVYCFDHGKSPIIQDNFFVNAGLSCKNTFAITCRGDEGYIVNNTICDFGYGAISIGHNTGEQNDNTMIVERNNIYYSSGYDGSPLIDGGAVYLYPNTENCIVRYNCIRNIYGRGSNRGIYCDNGAHGFTLYGNVITHIENSYCIDSWLYRKDPINNTNNIIMLNIVDGRCRFEGAEEKDNDCFKGPNFIMNSESWIQGNKINNFSIIGDDIELSFKGRKNSKMSFGYRDRRVLRHYKILNRIKRFIR